MDQEELEEGELPLDPSSIDIANQLKAEKEKKKQKKSKKNKGSVTKDLGEGEESDQVEKIEKKVKTEGKSKQKKRSDFISSTYKTKPCEFYKKGACQKGDECPFSHDFPVEKLDTLCKFYLTGNCTKGDDCVFSHDLKKYPCKFFWGPGICKDGNNCRFSHELPQDENRVAKIFDFIKDNEEFLTDTYNKYHRINLGQYYFDYMNSKSKEERKETLLLPPGMDPNYRPPPFPDQIPNPMQMNPMSHPFNPPPMHQPPQHFQTNPYQQPSVMMSQPPMMNPNFGNPQYMPPPPMQGYPMPSKNMPPQRIVNQFPPSIQGRPSFPMEQPNRMPPQVQKPQFMPQPQMNPPPNFPTNQFPTQNSMMMPPPNPQIMNPNISHLPGINPNMNPPINQNFSQNLTIPPSINQNPNLNNPNINPQINTNMIQPPAQTTIQGSNIKPPMQQEIPNPQLNKPPNPKDPRQRLSLGGNMTIKPPPSEVTQPIPPQQQQQQIPPQQIQSTTQSIQPIQPPPNQNPITKPIVTPIYPGMETTLQENQKTNTSFSNNIPIEPTVNPPKTDSDVAQSLSSSSQNPTESDLKMAQKEKDMLDEIKKEQQEKKKKKDILQIKKQESAEKKNKKGSASKQAHQNFLMRTKHKSKSIFDIPKFDLDEQDKMNEEKLLQILEINPKPVERSRSDIQNNIQKCLGAFEYHQDKIPTPVKASVEDLSSAIRSTLNELKALFSS